jgi:hypothetical protein
VQYFVFDFSVLKGGSGPLLMKPQPMKKYVSIGVGVVRAG